MAAKKKQPLRQKSNSFPDELLNIARKELNTLRQPGVRADARSLGRRQFIEVVKTEWGAGEVKTRRGPVSGDSPRYQRALGIAAAEVYDRMFPKIPTIKKPRKK